MALGSTQPLAEMSYTEYFPGVKSGRHIVTVSKSGSLKLLEPSGPVTGLERDCFTSISY